MRSPGNVRATLGTPVNRVAKRVVLIGIAVGPAINRDCRDIPLDVKATCTQGAIHLPEDIFLEVGKAQLIEFLAPVIRFETEEEAISLANDTEFGLAAYFYARDIGRTWRVGEGIESGIIGIDTGIISTEVAPFGGVKESGIGREGSYQGIEEYVETKYSASAVSECHKEFLFHRFHFLVPENIILFICPRNFARKPIVFAGYRAA